MHTEELKNKLDKCMSLIFEHCDTGDEDETLVNYIFALDECGFNRDEIIEELIESCALSRDEADSLLLKYDNEV